MGAQAVKARNEATAAAIVFLIVSSPLNVEAKATPAPCARQRRAARLSSCPRGLKTKSPGEPGLVTTLSAGALSDLRLARELPCERFPFGTRVMGVVLSREAARC